MERTQYKYTMITTKFKSNGNLKTAEEEVEKREEKVNKRSKL